MTAAVRTPFDPSLPRGATDLAVALAGGLGVGVPVSIVFTRDSLAPLGVALGVVATGLTALTVAVAGRARNDARAVLGVFLGCVLPPTLLLLPTGIGVFFSAPAGLIASFAVLPLVLALRSAHARPCDDDLEQLFVVASLWLGTVSVATLTLAGAERPPTVALLLGLATLLLVVALVRDARRALFVARVRHGRHPGLVLEPAFPRDEARVHGTAGLERLSLVERFGSGPFRERTTALPLGVVRIPVGRLGLGLVSLAAVAWLGVVLLAP